MKKPKEKAAPSFAEQGAHQKRVEYRGKRYEMEVSEKVGEDGVIESHLNYSPVDRPKGTKSRGNFSTGLQRCLGECKCPGRICDKGKKKGRK